MALEIHDRVKETTTTTGTGTYTLAGAVTGFETFTANLDNGDTTYYCCTDNTDFEIGIGTFTSSGTTLARTTILASSNSNSAVNWSSGTRTIFMTYPADKAVFEDASGHVSIPHDLFIAGGLIDLKNDGGAVSQIKFYCESSNAHAQTLIGAPHSESASNTLTLPSSGGNAKLLSATSTATVTNKSIDSDNNTITNIVNADIKSSAAIADTKLDTISTAGKVAISALDIDGGTDIGAALADADEIIVDDGGGGTNRRADMSRVKTYIADVTLTTAAQTNITSLGTLTALTVDNVAINGTTIGHTDDTDLMTVADGVLTVAGEVDATSLDISGDADIDGTLEADAITVNGTALNTVIAGVTVTNATNSAHVLVTDNESTNEENLITFVEDATTSTGNVGLEMDGNFSYNPSTGTVTATIFKGNIDAVDGDFDGTLEADAITVNGTALNTVIADEATALAIALG
jgi:cytoskeletal protein CcmA (bactofilin family)